MHTIYNEEEILRGSYHIPECSIYKNIDIYIEKNKRYIYDKNRKIRDETYNETIHEVERVEYYINYGCYKVCTKCLRSYMEEEFNPLRNTSYVGKEYKCINMNCNNIEKNPLGGTDEIRHTVDENVYLWSIIKEYFLEALLCEFKGLNTLYMYDTRRFVNMSYNNKEYKYRGRAIYEKKIKEEEKYK